MIGMILGNRYEILREIGSGGMANVYLAHCRLLNRNVAVKILKSEFVNDKEFLERFNKEAQVAATISSPNIVNVYDVGHDGDIHYIVMEYVEGQTLKEYIDANGMLSWQETVEYAMQICYALDKAHKSGIVHRDIKPQNIILTNDGILKVTDFGIARATSAETTNMGESTMGSVHYFSPEQARGGYTDAKSDIYSLGIVMYELITGILPFNGESPIAIAIKHMQSKPVSPKEFNISIPLAVESIILKAMSKEQSLRYQSAEEMLADLNKAMHSPSDFSTVTDVPVNYGNTIKMDPVKFEEPVNEPEQNNTESTARRPVHSDGKKKKTDDKAKKEKKNNGNAMQVVLAVAAAMVAILIMVFAAFKISSCSAGGDGYEVPDFMGMQQDAVIEKYDTKNGGDFEIKVINKKSDKEPGTVIEQSPEAGKIVKGNLTITIWVASSSDSIKVSDIVGMSKEAAKKELEKCGIEVKDKNVPVENEKDIGKVVRTDRASDEKLSEGDKLTIYIGVKGVAMEDIAGIKFKDAREWLKNNKLVLGTTEPENPQDNSIVTGVFVKDDEESNGRKAVYSGDLVAEGAIILLTLSEAVATEQNKEITVMLPADKSEVQVRVLQDGREVHNKKHYKSEISFSMNVAKPANSSISKVEIFFDGELSMEFDVTWR